MPYVNTEVENRDFKYYIFDWDDNILHMPTKIRMEHLEDDGTWKPVEVSTSTFALVVAPGVARMESQAPDVDGVTYLVSSLKSRVSSPPVGSFINVRLTRVCGFDFEGVLV